MVGESSMRVASKPSIRIETQETETNQSGFHDQFEFEDDAQPIESPVNSPKSKYRRKEKKSTYVMGRGYEDSPGDESPIHQDSSKSIRMKKPQGLPIQKHSESQGKNISTLLREHREDFDDKYQITPSPEQKQPTTPEVNSSPDEDEHPLAEEVVVSKQQDNEEQMDTDYTLEKDREQSRVFSDEISENEQQATAYSEQYSDSTQQPVQNIQGSSLFYDEQENVFKLSEQQINSITYIVPSSQNLPSAEAVIEANMKKFEKELIKRLNKGTIPCRVGNHSQYYFLKSIKDIRKCISDVRHQLFNACDINIESSDTAAIESTTTLQTVTEDEQTSKFIKKVFATMFTYGLCGQNVSIKFTDRQIDLIHDGLPLGNKIAIKEKFLELFESYFLSAIKNGAFQLNYDVPKRFSSLQELEQNFDSLKNQLIEIFQPNSLKDHAELIAEETFNVLTGKIQPGLGQRRSSSAADSRMNGQLEILRDYDFDIIMSNLKHQRHLILKKHNPHNKQSLTQYFDHWLYVSLKTILENTSNQNFSNKIDHILKQIKNFDSDEFKSQEMRKVLSSRNYSGSLFPIKKTVIDPNRRHSDSKVPVPIKTKSIFKKSQHRVAEQIVNKEQGLTRFYIQYFQEQKTKQDESRKARLDNFCDKILPLIDQFAQDNENSKVYDLLINELKKDTIFYKGKEKNLCSWFLFGKEFKRIQLRYYNNKQTLLRELTRPQQDNKAWLINNFYQFKQYVQTELEKQIKDGGLTTIQALEATTYGKDLIRLASSLRIDINDYLLEPVSQLQLR